MESQRKGSPMKRTTKPAEETSSKLTITKEFLASVKPTGERQVFRDDKARGLLLRVNGDGSKAWYLDYRDPVGKRQSFKIGDADRIDPGMARKKLKDLGDDPAAERREQKAEAERAEVEVEKAAARTLRKFLEGRYWDDHLKRAASGLATQKRILAAWKPLLDVDMQSITVDAALKHRAARLGAGANPRTLNRDRIALMAALNTAAHWELLTSNPINTPAFKPLAATNDVDTEEADDSDTDDGKRVRWLGKRDNIEDIRDDKGNVVGERQRFMDALVAAGTPPYLRDLSLVAMNTGLRRGELFKLQWSRVSISLAMLTVAAATSRKSKKQRHLALNAVALDVFKDLWAARETEKQRASEAGEPIKMSPYVFVNADTGKPFTTLKKSWKVLVTRAQVSDFTFHDLRHDFASRLVQAGANLYQVKDLLGHSSITLTERYAHLAPHQTRAAVALLEGAA